MSGLIKMGRIKSGKVEIGVVTQMRIQPGCMIRVR